MGNDPILTLSQSAVLNLYTMVTIVWSRLQESNPYSQGRSLLYYPLYESEQFGRGYWDRTSDDRVKVCSVTATLTPNSNLVQPPRIELGSMALQTTAMTTSAKVALAGPERLELPTSSFEDWHSIHLS